jgi:hypothetical protein
VRGGSCGKGLKYCLYVGRLECFREGRFVGKGCGKEVCFRVSNGRYVCFKVSNQYQGTPEWLRVA